ncbi:MAG: hypothetical protein GPOALKHO_000390 [Sodalis sp.]|nr:MAG: hypothetical protein GPOALKHO_000390 [Sodalis sp.]
MVEMERCIRRCVSWLKCHRRAEGGNCDHATVVSGARSEKIALEGMRAVDANLAALLSHGGLNSAFQSRLI